jgi:uncharacterized protein (DUF433 family)
MAARIIDRGRGPEIEGTRVTVYRIMDFLREGSSPERIATELDLTGDQVQAAIGYIATNQREADEAYEAILQRINEHSSSAVEAGRALSADELKQRIRARRFGDLTHADSRRQ